MALVAAEDCALDISDEAYEVNEEISKSDMCILSSELMQAWFCYKVGDVHCSLAFQVVSFFHHGIGGGDYF